VIAIEKNILFKLCVLDLVVLYQNVLSYRFDCVQFVLLH